MTFLNPSSTSLSFRLSSSLFICVAGNVFVELRELLAAWAASRVKSRAADHVSHYSQNKREILEKTRDIPLSSTLEILDIDSMGDHEVSRRIVMEFGGSGGAKRLHLEDMDSTIPASHLYTMKTNRNSNH
jgi:hypothetical protein